MATPDASLPAHCTCCIDPQKHKQFMRFRLGCAYDLEVNQPAGRARSARVCKLCSRHAREDGTVEACVEDEKHLFTECREYLAIRAEFEERLLLSTRSMAECMHQAPPRELAEYVSRLFEHRANRLSSH